MSPSADILKFLLSILRSFATKKKFTSDSQLNLGSEKKFTWAFFCSFEVIASVYFLFRDVMFSVYSVLHNPIICRQTEH